MKSPSNRKALSMASSVLGAGTRLQGTLHVEESIRIDGRLEGNIEQSEGKTHWVVIGPTSEIIGDIHAQNVRVAGKIIGNIIASGNVELTNGAEVRGNIKHSAITVEPGASVHGQLIANNYDDDLSTTASAPAGIDPLN
ncbi:MAG: polymer-forming cytoskeletal protein [Oxalobacteraceae bacterium]|jgi:cytoskeletal protein CcmA (bactofilin family)|nr:polymer-forming cytoskeletal protein [Oxalobacteraceae bacterium]